MADMNTIGGLHYEMMRRCYNPKSVAYKDYGAKGMIVCEQWHDREAFRKWCKENGYKKGMRLERIDSKKGYEPSNCRFGESMKKKDGESQYHKNVRKHRDKLKKMAGIDENYCKTRLYSIYWSMHDRCYYETHKSYHNYGGRGIKVCDEWNQKDGFFYFYKWAMSNGYQDGLSIDRIDVNGNYEPNNCRWTTMKEQHRNRRNTLKCVYDGVTIPIIELSEITGYSYGKLRNRIVRKGMTADEAIKDIKKEI